MSNPRVLLEHVSLVRQLLAASEHPGVARVGKLGEITYLVDELVESAELEIYDRLSEGLNPRNPRLQDLRQSLQPHVGQCLLRVGMQCEFREYTIHVDPGTKTIVHLVGFCLVAPPEAPKDASPADQARWIFAHPRDGWRDDGRRVVEILLAGRDVAELSSEELSLLAWGYNFGGHHAKSFETAKLGLAREPRSREWLALAQQYAWNAYLNDLPRLLTACDTCIAARVGPAAFWHLLKADRFIDAATGESELEDFEWSPGDSILHPEFLRLAAESLEAALDCEPGLRDQEADHCWVGDWSERFAAVLQESAFGHLKQPGRTNG